MFTCLYPWQYLHTHFVHQSLIWYNHILTYHYKITICIKKKSSSKNKWTRNNLYPYIWTHPFWHLWAFCFFCVLLINKKTHKFCIGIQWKFLPRLVPIGYVVSEKIKMWKFMDDDGDNDGHQVMAIHRMTYWVRWAKKVLNME